MSFRALLLSFAFFPTVVCPAVAGEETDPTDARMGAAMEENPSTAGMVEAIVAAHEEWDKRLNAAYQRLKKVMEPSEWAALVAAQKAWIVFRDAQKKSLDATFELMEGTMYIPISVEFEMNLTRDRARYLENYAEMIAER